MKNVCFIGAMSAELNHLDNLLGKEKTSFYIVRNNELVSIDEKDVVYLPSKKLGLSVVHALKDKTFEHVLVVNEYENNVATMNIGVGIQNALAKSKVINADKYEYFINIGTAGALDENLKIGDIVSVNKAAVIQNDDLFIEPLNYVDKYETGGVLTCKEFVNVNEKKSYKNVFEAMNLDIKAVDMELFAIRHCLPQIISLKVISDDLSHNNENFVKNFPSFIKNYYNPAIKKILTDII